jgi:Zn-dependent alcohol dehydrogenase
MCGRGGQPVLIGMAPPGAPASFDALTTTLEERAIRGRCYGSCLPLRDVPMLVELYRSGRLRLDLLVTEIELEGVNDAFARMERGEGARSVIVYDGAG